MTHSFTHAHTFPCLPLSPLFFSPPPNTHTCTQAEEAAIAAVLGEEARHSCTHPLTHFPAPHPSPTHPHTHTQAEEAAIAAVLGEEATEGDEVLAAARRLTDAYGQKLTDAIDLEEMRGEEGE